MGNAGLRLLGGGRGSSYLKQDRNFLGTFDVIPNVDISVPTNVYVFK